MKYTVLITGATSGIGLALAQKYLSLGHKVVAIGRNTQNLNELQNRFPNQLKIFYYDMSLQNSEKDFLNWESAFAGFDHIILNAGMAEDSQLRDWSRSRMMIDTNVGGTSELIHRIINSRRHFIKKDPLNQNKSVVLAVNTSIAGLRGLRQAPFYSASKAYQINLLQALRGLVRKESLDLKIVDIRPGFVETKMAGGQFWMCTTQQAAEVIYDGILRQKKIIYVTPRWTLVAWLLKLLPTFLHERV